MPRPKKINEPKSESSSTSTSTSTEIRSMVSEIIYDEFSNGIFQWKSIKLDKTFTQKMLTDLGKEGWKFAFVLDTSVWKKDGISEIYMQKFIKKGKS